MLTQRLLLSAVLTCLLAVGIATTASASDDSQSTFSYDAPHQGPATTAPDMQWAGVNAILGAQKSAAAEAESRNEAPLANGELRQLVRDSETGTFGPTSLSLDGDRVRVEVLSGLSSSDIRSLVSSFGGEVYGEVPRQLVEALVPVDQLVALEATDAVTYVRPPVIVGVPLDGANAGAGAESVSTQSAQIIGEEVAKTNADAWHDAGIVGQGVKIGIIDGFDGSAWTAAQNAGEIPAQAGTYCKYLGSNCDIWSAGVVHGEAVAEIIHEMAPDAQLYLATAYTSSDLQGAVDYFHSQGVRIISRSETSPFDGPGDGSGPTDSVANSAVADGMLWVNAAGNNASEDGQSLGSYWRGTWNDPNHNGIMNFQDGSEVLPIFCGFLNGLRWSDWGAMATDYDVYIFDTPSSVNPKVSSVNSQSGGAPPLELAEQEELMSCSSDMDVDGLVIQLAANGNGPNGDVLELMGNGTPFFISQNPYSAVGPLADSSSPGALAIGAIDPPMGTTIGYYSSWGPTNDERIKPDLSAASGVSGFTYGPNGFSGTSAATPAVSGAAALVLAGGLADDPTSLADYLKAATVERGTAGVDPVYGAGELTLPNPPGGPIPTPTPGPSGEPTPSPTPTGWSATNFQWFKSLSGAGQVSECDHNKPVPPNNPHYSGLCVAFDLTIPHATYDFGVKLVYNGQTVIDDSSSTELWTGQDWELSITAPIPDGSYHLELSANGQALGQADVTVGDAPATPTPSPTPSPSPSPTPSPTEVPAGSQIWGNTDCGTAVNVGDAIDITRDLVGLSFNAPAGCPGIGDPITVDGAQMTWGNWNCQDGVNVGDAIADARFLIGLSVNQGAGCPTIGSTVVLE